MTDMTAAPAAPAAAPAAPVAAISAPPAAPASSAAAALSAPAPAPAAAAPVADPAAAPAAPPAAPALTVPGKDATPEQWNEFYGKLGRPEKADEYGLVVNDGEDPAFIGEVAGVMHKYGLTKDQALGLQKDLTAGAQARLAQAETARIAALDSKNQAEQAELKTELGDRYDAQFELGKRAARQFAGDQAADIITAIEDKIGYKATMKFFMSVGAGLGEHDSGGQAKPGQGGERVPDAALFYGNSAKK